MKKYLVLTFLWSWLLWLPAVISSADINVPEVFLAFGMLASFGPSLAGLYLTWRDGEKSGLASLLKRFIRIEFPKRRLLLIIFLIPVTAAASYGIARIATGDSSEPLTIAVIGTLIGMFFIGGPLGEEFGWRGYALEKLQQRYSALKAGVIIGLIWGIWHLPLHFISGTSQEFVPIWADILITVLISVLITWVYNNTGRSILAVMLFHWSSNAGAILFPYWQLGGENLNTPNLWIPTAGMYIGFFVLLVVVIGVTIWNRAAARIPTKN